MAVEKTFNGNTYNSDTSFAEYKYITALLTMAGDIMADAGRAMVTTSSTEYTIGDGTGSVVMADAVPFQAGGFFVMADAAAPTTNYAFCQITGRTGTTLAFTEVAVAGSGTKTAWMIGISGARGVPGALSGALTGDLDHGNTHRSVNVPTPEASHHGVPRSYVDSAVAAPHGENIRAALGLI